MHTTVRNLAIDDRLDRHRPPPSQAAHGTRTVTVNATCTCAQERAAHEQRRRRHLPRPADALRLGQ